MAGLMLAWGCSSEDTDQDGGPDGGGSTNKVVNVSGGYVGRRTNTNGSAQINFDFDQSGSVLRGVYADSSAGSGPVNGTVVGKNLEFVTLLNSGDLIIEWNGTANDDATVLQGTWKIIVGGGENGDWIATR
jgi:hypothetical protein